ncbi:MAG: 4-hydroxythreonine-4-phosphate dehydrogenase PdxA [Bacteroidales bacterium]|nr:4-hydroxythreonine-4-phosphate dehydrogenase PdxA [Candidatus Cacconaster merdequi]
MGKKRIVGITQGDTNGIGYEVIIKTLSDVRILDSFIPVIYGSSRFFGIYKKMLFAENDQIVTNVINSASDARPKRINIINVVPDNLAIEPGQPTVDGAKAAIMALEAAVRDAKAGLIDAIVTAPFNKHTVSKSGFSFPGHTEYLVKEFDKSDGLMLLCSDHMRIGIATNHLPIAKISGALTVEGILSKLWLMNDSLKRDFGIVKPKIAVLGLNPHAGDAGSLGTEEQDIIIPAIEAACNEKIAAFGPYSPDGFFGTCMHYRFDAVLAMYHDQGLIPFKTLAFNTGVNFTAGLPIVRTSPDHGTGYDIVGKGIANPSSMLSAIFSAIDFCDNRARYREMNANPMEVRRFEGPKYERTILPE